MKHIKTYEHESYTVDGQTFIIEGQFLKHNYKLILLTRVLTHFEFLSSNLRRYRISVR